MDLDKLAKEFEMIKAKRLELARWGIEFLKDNPKIDRQFIARSAQLIVAEATNQRIEEPQEVNLEDFLRSKRIRPSKGQLVSFGKAMAEMYRRKRGRLITLM